MKNLLIITMAFGLLFLSNCKNHEAHNGGETMVVEQSAQGDYVAKTLNGFTEFDAGGMINHFIKSRDNDKSPTPASFWISKEMIHNIVTLLDAEIAEQRVNQRRDNTGTFGITDGIRIHIASNTSIDTYPLSNTILLVSTKDNGPYKGDTCSLGDKRRHKDYYQHDGSAELFQMRNYDIPTYGSAAPGARLFASNNVSQAGDCTGDNSIEVGTAETMVHGFLTPHIINTYGVWFSIEFWHKLDQIATENFDGIRIYFAKYDEKVTCPLKKTRDTFVIATTKRDPLTGLTSDYFDCDKTYFYDKPQNNGGLCPYNCN